MARESVAVPSMNPGGLDAPRSGHFGHCDVFTLVHVEDGAIKEVVNSGKSTSRAGWLFRPCEYSA